MPQIMVIMPLAFDLRGVQVEEFQPSDEALEVSDELAEHAGLVEEGFIEIVGSAKTDDDSGDAKVTAAQLREALTARGIAFKANAPKAELQALLDAAEKTGD